MYRKFKRFLELDEQLHNQTINDDLSDLLSHRERLNAIVKKIDQKEHYLD